MSSLCTLLLLLLSVTLSKTQVMQTFFGDLCGNGSVPHSQTQYDAVDEVNEAVCAVQCAEDGSCAAFSHPPCELHSAEQSLVCSMHHVANCTFVKQWSASPLAASTCHAPFVLDNNNQSCYFYSDTEGTVPQSQLQQTCDCMQAGAHLVAINTQQEHDAIKAYLREAGPACSHVWTAGHTDNPAGLTDWYWDLGTTTQNITYFDWVNGEPDNLHGGKYGVLAENAIVLKKDQSNYAFIDTAENMSYYSWFQDKNVCFLCELNLP